MLKSVRIKNYKSCGDVYIKDIVSMNALIGRNSTGKTNVLTAIEWALNLAVSVNNIEWENISKLGDKSEFIFDIELDSHIYRYSLDVEFSIQDSSNDEGVKFNVSLNEKVCLDGNNEDLIVREGDKVRVKGWDSPLELEENTPCLSLILKLLPKIPASKHIEKIVSFFRSVNYYPLDEIDSRGRKIDP